MKYNTINKWKAIQNLRSEEVEKELEEYHWLCAKRSSGFMLNEEDVEQIKEIDKRIKELYDKHWFFLVPHN